MRVSSTVDDALEELREHVLSGIPVGGADLDALLAFVALFRPDFEANLGDAGGAAKWRADRVKVLSAARVVGHVAGFVAAMNNRPAGMKDLKLGLAAVKPHCQVLVTNAGDAGERIMRIYCANVDVES
jgi:hypothetical protein